jgi:hypothetical protein
VSVPEGEDLDAARVGVHLVVEVVSGSTQQEPTDPGLLRVTSTRADTGLSRDELERALEILEEGEWRCWTIGSPPRRCRRISAAARGVALTRSRATTGC